MTQTQTTDYGDIELKRRQLMRRAVTGTTGVALAGYGGTQIAGSPVGKSQAIAPLVAAGAVGASVAAGWALREFEVIGSDDPAEGQTPDALREDVYNTARTRKSTNASTIVDNRNILDGIEDSVYSEGKIAAIKTLSNEESQSAVETAAHTAVDDYVSTIIENLIKTWNEAVLELDNLVSSLNSHPDTHWEDVFYYKITSSGYVGEDSGISLRSPKTREETLPDGSTITVQSIDYKYYYRSGGSTRATDGVYNPYETEYDELAIEVSTANADMFRYLLFEEWNAVLSEIQTVLSDVKSGLTTWVDNVYGQVQTGDLDTSELLGPRELAELAPEDGNALNQAQADLMALNIPTDIEREAEVYLPDIDATIYGQLSYTGGGSLSTGTVDPSTDSEDYYLTYDVSAGSGTWSAYNTGLDAGILTFTQEPFKKTDYQVETSYDETVTLTAGDFTENSGNFEADLSDDLENPIAEATSISYYSTVDETQYETIKLSQVFEIKEFTDPEGNEYQKANFERSEPQTDDNYITQEEWDERRERQEKLIEKYEDSQEETTGISLSSSDGGLIAAAAGGLSLLWIFGGS